jgi:Mrp family chromosome partitioning ATPase
MPKGSEIITVAFQDRNPAAARIAVQAVIDAYNRLYGDSDSDSITARLRVLEDRRTKLEADAKDWNDKILAITSQVGTGKELLDELQHSKLAELAQVETQLRQAQLAVAFAADSSVGNSASSQPAPPTETNTATLPNLQELLAERQKLMLKLESEEGTLGTNHPVIIATNNSLSLINRDIEQAQATYRALGMDESPGANPAIRTKSVAQLKMEEENVQKVYNQLQVEAAELGRKCIAVSTYQAEADDCKAKLTETNQRIEQLNLESSVGGRIVIESKGDQPLLPVKDKRKQMAAVGGLGLGMAGVGCVALLGFMDRRVRGVFDIGKGTKISERILGVLPFLPDDLADPDQAMMAAHGVHQIRAMLQQGQAAPCPVLAVTSSSPGSGKTSLAIALGLSFAASGSRVLLIDCDIIGGGLTARMKQITRRRLGQILQRQGLVNKQQIKVARERCKQTGESIGEAMVKLGHVSSADIANALNLQQESKVGLREAMNGESAMDCIASTGTPGLFLMPLGSADRRHVGRMSNKVVRCILDQVRNRFDVVLIDTGPILGSLEASVVAMASDAVVLTVARGEQRPLLEQAKVKVAADGGRIAGIVLNRANARDLLMSGYSSSTSRVSNNPLEQPQLVLTSVEHKSLRLGPIGTAVASLTDASRSRPQNTPKRIPS